MIEHSSKHLLIKLKCATAGFKGPRCETEDKCSKVVCQNHGKCRESISGGSPYCECQSGFTGANCETSESQRISKDA